jgi:hypothetical protein
LTTGSMVKVVFSFFSISTVRIKYVSSQGLKKKLQKGLANTYTIRIQDAWHEEP